MALNALSNLTAGELPDLQPLLSLDLVQLIASISLTHIRSRKILYKCVQILTNIARDQSAIEILISHNIIVIINNVFKHFDDDIELLELVMECIQSLSLSPVYIGDLVNEQIPSSIGALIRKHVNVVPFLKKSLESLSRLIQSNDIAASITNQRAIEVLLVVITTHYDNDDVLSHCMSILISLSVTETASVRVAQLTLTNLIQSIKRHVRKQVFLRTAASVIANLSLFPQSAAVLIEQTDFFYEMVTAISVNADYPSILVQFLRALSSLIATSEKAIPLLEAHNAVMIVRKAASKHPKHEQLKQVVEQFIKRMKNEDEEVKNIRGNRPLTIAEQLPPGVRSMLQGGSVFTWHSDSHNPKSIHLRANETFEALQWFEGAAKGAKQYGQMSMAQVSRIQPGACTSALRRKRFMASLPDPTKIFAIIIDASKITSGFSLSLEAADQESVATWCKALLLLQRLNSTQHRFRYQDIITSD